jgi:hypothetical protein
VHSGATDLTVCFHGFPFYKNINYYSYRQLYKTYLTLFIYEGDDSNQIKIRKLRLSEDLTLDFFNLYFGCSTLRIIGCSTLRKDGGTKLLITLTSQTSNYAECHIKNAPSATL